MQSIINEVLSKAYIDSIEKIKSLLRSELGLSEIEANYVTSYYTAIKELNLFSSKTFKNFEYDGELFDLNDVQKFIKFPESFYDIVMLVFHNEIFLDKYEIGFNGITVKLQKKSVQEKDVELKEDATPFDQYKVAEDANYYTFYAPTAAVGKELRTFYPEMYKDEDIRQIPNFFLPNWCIVSSHSSYHFAKEKHSKSDIWLFTYSKTNPAEKLRQKFGVDSLLNDANLSSMLNRTGSEETIKLRNQLGEVYLMKKDGTVGVGRNYGHHNYSNMQGISRAVSELKPSTLYSYSSIDVTQKQVFSKQFEIEEGKLKKCLTDSKVIVVPLGVTEIESEAFSKLSRVEQVVLPPSTIKISTHAFIDMPNLKKVFVHNTLEVIETDAFKNVTYYDKIKNGIYGEGMFLFGVLEKTSDGVTVSKPSQLRFAPKKFIKAFQNIQEISAEMNQYSLQPGEEALEESFRVKRSSYEMQDYYSIEAGNRFVIEADPEDAINVTDLVIPEGIEYLMGSLKNFTNLQTLTLSSSVKELKGLNFKSSKILEDLKKLKVFDMSQSQVTSLTSFKLFGLLNLRTVLLPKGLIEMDPEFFANTGVEQLFIPLGVADKLMLKSFKNMPFLEVIMTDNEEEFINKVDEAVLNYIEKQKIQLVEKEH